MNQPSFPRKALADLYAAYPWLKDLVSSLEAEISALANKKIAIEQDFEDLTEDNDEMADKILKQSHNLKLAQSDYVSLDARYQMLLDVVVKLTQGS